MLDDTKVTPMHHYMYSYSCPNLIEAEQTTVKPRHGVTQTIIVTSSYILCIEVMKNFKKVSSISKNTSMRLSFCTLSTSMSTPGNRYKNN